ncbi:hypothetical protein BH11PLA1_BH11PLA1_02420 [soil metagenome]
MHLFKPGNEIEGLRVMSELGKGAASVIYLVQDPKTKQIWALKHVIKETEKDERFLEQTESEYHIASKLDHPNIRKVDRLIKKKSGLLSVSELYLIMELVDGISVDRLPPKTFEQASEIFEATARALAYMHTKGFVHADMKPNNIIVDANGNPKVIDLGQSCAVGTVKKRIQGTPDYIAPEQVHRRPIIDKTDIYNLGATMYWALTRKHVPTALGKEDSLLGTVDDSMLVKPKRPIEMNARVPELFDQLIMQCVEIDQAKRPGSMNEVADRLAVIRGKLLQEATLRKSGSFRRVAQ